MSSLPNTNAGTKLANIIGTREVTPEILELVASWIKSPSVELIIDSSAVDPSPEYTPHNIIQLNNTHTQSKDIIFQHIRALDLRYPYTKFELVTLPVNRIRVLENLSFIDAHTWLKFQVLNPIDVGFIVAEVALIISNTRYILTDRKPIKDLDLHYISLFKYARPIRSTILDFRTWWRSRTHIQRLQDYWIWEQRKIIMDFILPSVDIGQLYNFQSMLSSLYDIKYRQLAQHQLITAVPVCDNDDLCMPYEESDVNETSTLNLPVEIMYNIMYDMEYKDILSYCQTNTQARTICSDRRFWLNKLDRDFPDTKQPLSSYINPNDLDGKAIYKRFYSLYPLRNTYAMSDAVDRGYIDVALWLYLEYYPKNLVYLYMKYDVRMIHIPIAFNDDAPYTKFDYVYDELSSTQLNVLAQYLLKTRTIHNTKPYLIQLALHSSILSEIQDYILNYLHNNIMIRTF